MDIHRFDQSGFYVKSHKARLDPEETKVQEKDIYLNPPNSYFGDLPATGENEILRLTGDGVSIVPDYKGQHYYEPDGGRFLITDYGVLTPDGALQTDPPSEYHDTHDGSEWVENTARKAADEAEAARQAEIELEQQSSGTTVDTPAEAKAKINSVYQPVFDVIDDIKTGDKTDTEKLALLIDGFETFATKARAIDRQIAARLLK